jgi:hypothetical protein
VGVGGRSGCVAPFTLGCLQILNLREAWKQPPVIRLAATSMAPLDEWRPALRRLPAGDPELPRVITR